MSSLIQNGKMAWSLDRIFANCLSKLLQKLTDATPHSLSSAKDPSAHHHGKFVNDVIDTPSKSNMTVTKQKFYWTMNITTIPCWGRKKKYDSSSHNSGLCIFLRNSNGLRRRIRGALVFRKYIESVLIASDSVKIIIILCYEYWSAPSVLVKGEYQVFESKFAELATLLPRSSRRPDRRTPRMVTRVLREPKCARICR